MSRTIKPAEITTKQIKTSIITKELEQSIKNIDNDSSVQPSPRALSKSQINKYRKIKSYTKEALVQAFMYLVRTNFYAFCVYYDPEFFTPAKKHLKIIAYYLQKVSNGEIKKLAISIPPRAGKSYTVSLWCAWLIGRGVNDPNTSIMRNAYSQSIAEKFSYDIRAIIQTDKYLSVFPDVKLKSDHSSVEDWAIEGASQSTYFCAGVGGAITGKGCRTVAISDDLVKNLEDAMSETILTKTWNWYLSTHLSRLETGCPIVNISTRWSKQDVIGKCLETEKDEWTIISVPALLSDGKSFCEEIKTTEEYLELKKILDPYIWEAEFMQNPIEEKSVLFPASELNYFSMDELKNYYSNNSHYTFDAVVGYTDTADEGTDYLCSGSLAIIGDKYYLTDVVYTQDPIEVTESLVADLIIREKQIRHIVESNSGGKSFGRNVKQLVLDKHPCHIKWVPTTKNKETRILMSSGIIKDRFYFRNDYKPGSDYDNFMRALTSYVKFGKNKHDDAPDMLTGLAEMVTRKGLRFL